MTIRLDLINSMLATTGTAKLSSEDTTHPAYVTADFVLSTVIEEFSSKPMWFNTTRRTLSPNTDGRIVVPGNALSCDPDDITKDYAIRGQYLFDNGNYTDIIGTEVAVVIVAELPLEDMPPIALQFIRAHARLYYYTDVDGTSNKIKMYADAFAIKERELITLNMKHTDSNFFRGRGYASFAHRRSASFNPLTRIT
jgi:hypothetical protein